MAGSPSDISQHLPAARAGSREALGQALEACRCYLLLIANRQLDPALQAKGGASDLVQDTFLEAQRDFAQFAGGTEDELRAWLKRLLLNNVANFARRYRDTDKRQLQREMGLPGDSTSTGPGAGLPADTPSPSGQAMAHEQAEAIQKALQRLPEDYRRIITLRYQEDRSFEEIAQLLQRSENAARKLWFRAVERLQQELDTPP
jgi:RNA polymerase sigma-70 factor, ECF subfamily